jgi:signal peptidase II
MTPSRAIRMAIIFLILAATVGCDQVAKHFARVELSHFRARSFPGGFLELTLAENPGAFLSMGASLPKDTRAGLFIAMVSVGLTALLAYLVGVSKLGWYSLIGLALVWAGGVSNLIDRLTRHGLVTDFILIRVGPLHTGVFNVADMIIVIGMVSLIASLRATAGKSAAAPKEKSS